MLELVPRLWAGRRFTVRRDGRDVADITLSWFREAGRVDIDGEEYDLSRERLASGEFTLSRGGYVLAKARKAALRNRFEVEHEGNHLEVVKATWWGRRFDVRSGGRTIGSIAPQHALTRRAVIDLPAELDLPVKVFIAALVVFLWRRQSAGAGGG